MSMAVFKIGSVHGGEGYDVLTTFGAMEREILTGARLSGDQLARGWPISATPLPDASRERWASSLAST